MSNHNKRANNDKDYEERNHSSDYIQEKINKSNDNSEEKNQNNLKLQDKAKMNYIQNFKNNYKYQGYSDIHKKSNNNGINNFNPISLAQDSIQSQGTINHEETNSKDLRTNQPNIINDKYFKERFESHSPEKLIDVLHNLDHNIFVKITKRDQDKKIDINSFQHRASQFREKTKNSLTQLANILNTNVPSGQEASESNSNKGSSTKISKVALRSQNSKASKQSETHAKIPSKEETNGKDNHVQQESQRMTPEVKQISRNNDITIENREGKNLSNTNPSLSLNPHSNHEENQNKSSNTELDNIVENIYKRPKANKGSNKRDYSEDSHDINKINNKNSLHQKTIQDNKNTIEKEKNKEKKVQVPIDTLKNKETNNEVSTSTLLENFKINQVSSNQHEIYDESIREHLSEENLYKKKFIDYIKSQDDKIQLKSMISVEMASKFSDEIVKIQKNEYQNEMTRLQKKIEELTVKNKKLTTENTILKQASLSSISENEKKTPLSSQQSKYVLKLEKENILLKNEYINNIKNKNTIIKKYNEEINEFSNMAKRLEEAFQRLDSE